MITRPEIIEKAQNLSTSKLGFLSFERYVPRQESIECRSSMNASRRRELIAGLKSMVPISLGSIPYGLLYGALVSGLDAPLYFKVGMSPMVFSGSAQLVAIGLLMTNTPLPVIILSTLIVNLRHLFYGVSLMPYMKELSTRWRMLLAFLTVDEVYVLAIINYRERDWSGDQNRYFQWYYFGAGILNWVEWTITSIAGVFIARV